jgi:hypothetical protein
MKFNCFCLTLLLSAVCQAGVSADLNGDRSVDFQDFSLFSSQWLQQDVPPSAGVQAGQVFDYVIAAVNSSNEMKTRANIICDGTADNLEIQAAIDNLYANKGGKIFLCAGDYQIDSSIILKSGIAIEGVIPKLSSAWIPDLDARIVGGTCLSGPGTVIFKGNEIFNASLSNLGFKDVGSAIAFGETDRLGMGFGELKNIFVDGPTVTGIELTNSQHVHGNNIAIFNLGGSPKTGTAITRGLHILSDNRYNPSHPGIQPPGADKLHFQPGNCVFNDVYVMRSVGGDLRKNVIGIHLQAIKPLENGVPVRGMQLNYITLIRPQVNLFGWSGNTIGSGRYNLFLDGADKSETYVNSCTIIGADLEGINEYNCYLKYANNNKMDLGGTKSLRLEKAQYNHITPMICTSVDVTDGDSSVNFMTGLMQSFTKPNLAVQGMYYNASSNSTEISTSYTYPRCLQTPFGATVIQPKGLQLGVSSTVVDSGTNINPRRLYPEHGELILVDTSIQGSDIYIQLPPSAWYPGGKFTFKLIDDDVPYARKIILRPEGSEEIDGKSGDNTDLDTLNDTITIVSDGSNWFITNKILSP